MMQQDAEAASPTEHARSPETAPPAGKSLAMAPLAIEVFSIVLGVMLALGVNEWRQTKADRELATTARADIFREIEANLGHLRHVYEQNLTFQRWVDGAHSEGEEAPESLVYQPAWGLQDTAWQVARDTGALQHMGFEAVAGFSRVYSFQHAYRAMVLQLTQAQMIGLQMQGRSSLEADSLNRELSLRSQPVVQLLIANEKALLEAYEGALTYRD